MTLLISGYILTPFRSGLGRIELRSWTDGAVAINSNGIIEEVGSLSEVKSKYPNYLHRSFDDKFVLPAFVDLHTHPPQIDIIGSFGKQLLDWLAHFTFPAEREFGHREIAGAKTNRYIDLQLANGVTTAVWFGTNSEIGVDEMFRVSEKRGIRAVIGKVSMDQNAPEYLLQETKVDRDAIELLLQEWHGKLGRLYLALTPRFAPSCSMKLLSSLGRIAQDYPDLYIQTHVSENLAEVSWALECHPGHRHYTGIYADYGLLTNKTVLAHGIHLSESEIELINLEKSSVAHCPTSNQFLGSGLCPLHRFDRKGLGTDIGAGTTLCMWETMRTAYGIAQLQGRSLEPVEMFALSTINAAEALGFGGRLGALMPGYSADFQVLDWCQFPLLDYRLQNTNGTDDVLRALLAFGKEGLVEEVFCEGRQVWKKFIR